MWSELGRSPPLRPMRALRLQWSWAFSLMCEVALMWFYHLCFKFGRATSKHVEPQNPDERGWHVLWIMFSRGYEVSGPNLDPTLEVENETCWSGMAILHPTSFSEERSRDRIGLCGCDLQLSGNTRLIQSNGKKMYVFLEVPTKGSHTLCYLCLRRLARFSWEVIAFKSQVLGVSTLATKTSVVVK